MGKGLTIERPGVIFHCPQKRRVKFEKGEKGFGWGECLPQHENRNGHEGWGN